MRCLLSGNPAISEFPIPTPSSLLSAITAGPDGNLWFTEENSYQIGRITPSGTITEFTIPTPFSEPQGIAAARDGNLWFTEAGANQIGRITPSGTITEFTIPTSNSFATAIAAGPDGNLWFTESLANQIGQLTPVNTDVVNPITVPANATVTTPAPNSITFPAGSTIPFGFVLPAGTITEFAISAAFTSPGGITAGPDGNLWFAEAVANQIVRITPSGIITEYRVPTTNSSPFELTDGPDGSLWFNEYYGNQIGRITPTATTISNPTTVPADATITTPVGTVFPSGSTIPAGTVLPTGTITEFAIPTHDSSPEAITAGPDGSLWFTEYSADQIGRLTPSGTFTEFPIATVSSGPDTITAGADGNLWFAEGTANKIGRLDPPLTAFGAPVNASVGVPFTGVVATFTDPDPYAAPTDYTTTINWADGTTTAGQVTEDAAGTFYVTGSHTYAQAQLGATINVTIVDKDGSTTTASSAADVQSLPIFPVVAVSVPALPAAPKGTALSNVLVGSFTISSPSFPVGDLSTTVDWGDGSSVSVGFVGLASASGGVMTFDVRSDHTYFRDQQTPYTITVRVNENGVQVLSTTTAATVTNRPPLVTGIPVKMTRGLPFSAPVAYIVEGLGLPAEPAGDYSATINWGDGSKATVGTVASIPGGDWVVGTHTYARPGPYTITITVNEGAFTVVATAPAFDPPAGPGGRSRHFHRGTARSGHRTHASLTGGTAKPHRVREPLANPHLQPAHLRKLVP